MALTLNIERKMCRGSIVLQQPAIDCWETEKEIIGMKEKGDDTEVDSSVGGRVGDN